MKERGREEYIVTASFVGLDLEMVCLNKWSCLANVLINIEPLSPLKKVGGLFITQNGAHMAVIRS